MRDTRAFGEHLAQMGVSVQWLCGPDCPGGQVHRHEPAMAGKVPLKQGWSRLGYRPPDAVAAGWTAGANLSILTGWQTTARLSLVVVDLDSPESMAWAVAHLPPTPWRVRTRRGEHWYYRCSGPVRPRNFRHATPRTLTEADLKELGLSLGDRKRLLRAVALLGDGTASPPSPPPAPPALPAAGPDRQGNAAAPCGPYRQAA